ncbi:tryptophan synthase subunit alpha [Liquorilactobacillus mali]|uniref:Tryptophan synthase alpha chain n=1 Tax=Liquorilactobacillus mali KCTC 3596 = DSM 20444 TaxID=1046596 RepID=J0L1B2_9LACO|nr:tryptophan synthase subunit alpha [Liquorilactobacillus mali]EJF01540.1 tryptophan synthase alpha chain [Liquorilactobacillus mali KCTC 3596 = DSM 20444]KRN10621.1 tryptophan synthase [Liquorilactobacillus mali KCTC 3596 = DSM 20444]MDC7952919.1 tryptophan synthase subunit alpha [Liquorilactobacillus mali]QFQ75347.1 tryptophan synthase subunit alpha [Liquorilactobacillus mali]
MTEQRLREAFGKQHKAFIGFVTAGDPTFDKSVASILALDAGGADVVEVGIPFSDPVADGPVIQDADLRAFAAGITTTKVFELVEEVRRKSDVSLVLLVYLNNIFKYGYDRFFSKCKQVGIDGVIIPDLPMEERGEVLPFAHKYQCALIPLVAPTSAKRIPQIVQGTTGFVYVVSSMGVTGVRSQLDSNLEDMIAAIRNSTDAPIAVGFGIHTPEQAAKIAAIADGVIVGSAIVKIIAQNTAETSKKITEYTRKMSKAIYKINREKSL